MHPRAHRESKPEVLQTRRDFFNGIALVSILPILVVVYMSINVKFSSESYLLISSLVASLMTLVLGLLGVVVLWRYCWATVELRIYLEDVAQRVGGAGYLGTAEGPGGAWMLKSRIGALVSEQQKRLYALEAEKAAIERRLLLGNY